MADVNVMLLIKGIDDVTPIFKKISNTAEKEFQNIKSSVNSIPDVKIQSDVSDMQKIEKAVDEASQAIKSMPDPNIDGSGAASELDKVKKKAEETQKSIKEAFKDFDLQSMAGGMVAGGGIAGIIQKSLDTANLITKIKVSFDVPPESMKSVNKAVQTIKAYGVDAEAALEGVRRQWALNADASDKTNMKIVKGAAAIASAYAGIDFTELIQETNEIAAELQISDQNALGLVNSLLKVGFPPEQLDIISEYGQQLRRAGYSAEEIQAIFAAGIETGTWNIDNLLDGLKEGRILLAEFGGGVDKATAELAEKAGISASQLQEWGQMVAQGGETGKQAMVEVAKALAGIEDATLQNQLGVKLFGTMWEDQGMNIIETILNAQNAVVSLDENQKGLNDTIRQIDDNPAVKFKQAINDITYALSPLFMVIATVIGKLAEWASANPVLASTIVAIVSALGILIGALFALSPIVTMMITLSGALGGSLLALSGPVLAVVAVIGGLIAAGIALVKNWDTVGVILKGLWSGLLNLGQSIFSGLASFLSMTWEGIKSAASAAWNGIVSLVSVLWNGLKSAASTVFNSIKNFISVVWNTIRNVTSTVWSGIVSIVSGIWNGLKATATTVFNALKTVITIAWNTIKTGTTTVWNAIKSTLTGIWNGIKNTVGSVFNGIKNVIGNVWNGIRSAAEGAWNGIIGTIKGSVNGIIRIVNGMIDALNRVKIKLPKIPEWVPVIGGMGGGTLGFNIPKIPYLAEGGLATRKTLAVIGEGADDEAVIPLNDRVLAQLGSYIASHMGGNVKDDKQFAQLLADAIAARLAPLVERLANRPIRIIGNGTNASYDIEQINRDLYRLKFRSSVSKGLGVM